LNECYCYKRIYINKGTRTSFQYHQIKRETNYIIEGEAEVWLENDLGEIEKRIMKANEFFTVHPTMKHRIVALTDLVLQEVSTPEVDDIVRMQDDAGRPDGRIEREHQYGK
jgi:mannose-6-phosphate isomerase-like protein (cupin superfamily)